FQPIVMAAHAVPIEKGAVHRSGRAILGGDRSLAGLLRTLPDEAHHGDAGRDARHPQAVTRCHKLSSLLSIAAWSAYREAFGGGGVAAFSVVPRRISDSRDPQQRVPSVVSAPIVFSKSAVSGHDCSNAC